MENVIQKLLLPTTIRRGNIFHMANAWIGTSGFDYKEWKPTFYPPELPQKQFLQYYSGRLRSVELNNTFYQMPTPARIAAWSAATPEEFRFAIKAPRKITHQERLTTPSAALEYFVRTVEALKPRLGALLFQLPPFLKIDCDRLAAFLGLLPRELPAAFEFRHDSWFCDEVFRLLEEHAAALCINDGDEKTTPVRLTSRFTYLRLRRSQYSAGQRAAWEDRIRQWVRDGIAVYAYIKHEENPDAPRIALEFAEAVQSSPQRR